MNDESANGRQEESTGAVPLTGLKGEAWCNAILKSECVPMDSQILTRHGWTYFDDLVIWLPFDTSDKQWRTAQ